MRTILSLVLVLIISNTYAQKNIDYEKDSLRSINRWTVGLAFSSVENNGNGSGNPFNNFFAFKKEDANNSIPIRLNVEYRINDLFGFEVAGSFNKWNANEGFMDGQIIAKDYNYFALDAGARIYLDELFLDEPLNWALGSDWLDVYLTAGVGYFKINEGGMTGNIGIGSNIWLTENLGVSGSWVAKWAFDKTPAKYDTNHTQYALGLTYRFNYKDKDGDGIYDYNDVCPEIPGTKGGDGCPEDEAPLEEKKRIDSDNDGVLDSEDKCPNIAGSKVYNGCPIPDSDGDGILDDVDRCPKKYAKTDDGCPILDADNDGVIDSKDKCPEAAGTASNNGCPTVKPIDTSEIEKLSKLIQFNTNKDSFTNETYAILKNVISYVQKYPNSKFRIEGHTDSIGTYEFNKTLSQKRANAVKNYLVKNGIPATNLDAIGFGERQPIESNMYKSGRKINRRVEIIQVK